MSGGESGSLGGTSSGEGDWRLGRTGESIKLTELLESNSMLMVGAQAGSDSKRLI